MQSDAERGRSGGRPWIAGIVAASAVGFVALGARDQRSAEGAEVAVPARAVPRPDVIVVAVDGLGPRDLGVFGGDLAATPVMDELVRASVVYSDAYAPSPWASEALRQTLTGRYRDSDDAPPTLVDELGYLAYRSAFVPAHERHLAAVDGGENAIEFDARPEPLGLDDPAGALADAVAGAAVAWLGVGEQPSLLVVTFADPRPPHHRYPGLVAEADRPYGGPARAGLEHDDLLRTAPTFEPDDRDRLAALHASEVAAVDVALGKILRAAEERRATPPHVVLLGLRAPALGREGRYGLVPSLAPEDLRVPLAIRFSPPLTGSGAAPLTGVLDLPVSLVDVGPTLVDALGRDARLDLDGRSIFPGARLPDRSLHAVTTRGVRAAVALFGLRAIELACDPPRAAVHARRPSDEPVPALSWTAVSAPGLRDEELRSALSSWMAEAGIASIDETSELRAAPLDPIESDR